MDVISVPIEGIRIPERMRPLNESKVEALAQSIAAIGLQHPIGIVLSDDDSFGTLVTGNHRLAAAKRLGWEWIDAIEIKLPELDRQLWEIDENLMRAELTPTQEAEHLRRRKELWEQRGALALTGETAPNTGRKSADIGPGRPRGFAAETAAATGRAKSVINQAIRRAEQIVPEALAAVAGTSLDKGVELDALTKLAPEAQVAIAQRAAAGEVVSARQMAQIVPPAARPAASTHVVDQADALSLAWSKTNEEARRLFVARYRTDLAAILAGQKT